MGEGVNKNLDETSPFEVTGVMMQYYIVCKRELWFEYHNIEIDRDNKHISRGEIVDSTSYEYLDRQTLRLGPIAPDMEDDGKIIEIKPSSILEEASKLQLLYYLWYLDTVYDCEMDGVLAYPEEKTRKEVKLTSENREKVEKAIDEIYSIVQKDSPPELEKKPICDSCAYQDFCWLGSDGQ